METAIERVPVRRGGSVLDRLGPAPRIAVCRPGRLGDMIVMIPALAALRRAVPGARITYITQRAGVLLRDRMPMVDEVVEVPDSWDQFARYDELPEMQAFFDGMRRRHFDLALQCMGGGEHMNYLMARLGARITAGQRYNGAPPLDIWMPLQRPLQPEIIRLMDIMGLVGVPPGRLRPAIPELPSDAEALQAALDVDSLPHPLTAIHAGSGSGSRRWPAERYAAVIDTLALEIGGTVLLIGSDEERAVTAELRGHLERADVIDLAGELSLDGLIALLRRLDLYIGNDSGPGHLAFALDIPAVLIYGSGHPGTWASVFRARQRPVADVDAPCRLIGQRCGCKDNSSALCLQAVSVEQVLCEIHSLIQTIDAPQLIREEARA